jgi:hypothetical protein
VAFDFDISFNAFSIDVEIAQALISTTADCDPVSIYKSNGSTLVASVPAGGSYTIAKHSIFESDGSTLVAQQEFDENYTTPNSPVTDINTTVFLEAGEAYACTDDAEITFIFAAGQTQIDAENFKDKFKTNYTNEIRTGPILSVLYSIDGAPDISFGSNLDLSGVVNKVSVTISSTVSQVLEVEINNG